MRVGLDVYEEIEKCTDLFVAGVQSWSVVPVEEMTT